MENGEIKLVNGYKCLESWVIGAMTFLKEIRIDIANQAFNRKRKLLCRSISKLRKNVWNSMSGMLCYMHHLHGLNQE